MKKIIVFLLLLIVIAAGICYTYWQHNKKAIVKNEIETTLTSKTDSLYYVHYDSSDIDEINGNAVFYNVVLQSDTLQQKMIKSANTKLPSVLFNIHVKEVGILGVNVPGLLTNLVISARKIYLKEPVLQIIRTGIESKNSLTRDDTIELYKKIIGQYKSIKADSIEIIDGDIKVIDQFGKETVSLKKINIELNNFQVDSEHSYTNIISYFVKDLKASVKELSLPGTNPSSNIIFTNLVYNASKKYIAVQRIQEHSTTDTSSVFDINRIELNGLNTNLFVVHHQLQADTVYCNGGTLTLVVKGNTAKKGDPIIELSDNFFNQAQVGSVYINNTKLIVNNLQKPGQKPFELDSVKFSMYRKLSIGKVSTLSYLLNNAQWELSANGFSFNTSNKIYRVSIGAFKIDNASVSQISVSGIHIIPLLSKEAYGLLVKQQKDLYSFDFNNILLKGINIKQLIANNTVEATDLWVQPLLHIYNDRTLPSNDTTINLGKYPHQSLLKLKIPFYIGKIHVINGSVSYQEKSTSSKMVGNINFQNINGLITNVTNIPEKINAYPLCRLNVTASFLGTHFSTQWDFPLNTTNGAFIVSGELDSMNAIKLNVIAEPLGLMSVKQGYIDKLNFHIEGNDYGTNTNLELQYHQLNIDLLKKLNNVSGLKKKELVSLIANSVVKNSNPQNNVTRKITGQAFARNIHRPFFNLVWASIFTAAKKIVLSKKEK
ncbi:MAG: hypothetical protein WDM71_09500 [Ferruginibacter sp.]